jgi:hypothetical protein
MSGIARHEPLGTLAVKVKVAGHRQRLLAHSNIQKHTKYILYNLYYLYYLYSYFTLTITLPRAFGH